MSSRSVVTHVFDDLWLVVGGRPVHTPEDLLEVLRHVVTLVQHEGVEELGGLDPGRDDPVRDVVHDAGRDLGEVVIDQLATAEVRRLDCSRRRDGM